MDNELPQKENHNGKYQVQVLKFEILFCSMNRTCHFHKELINEGFMVKLNGNIDLYGHECS